MVPIVIRLLPSGSMPDLTIAAKKLPNSSLYPCGVRNFMLAGLVKALVSCQAPDGYLGPWPKGSRLNDQAPNVLLSKLSLGHHGPGGIWDGWGHNHLMLALMLWNEETGEWDIYDVQLANGTAYRVALDRRSGRWLAQGWYD